MTDVGALSSNYYRREHPHRERALAELAGRQHGVVGLRQLSELGFSRMEVDHRCRIGRLQPLYRGAYALGHTAITPRGRWTAALLACGPLSLLSHRASAAVWDLTSSVGTRIDVMVPGRSRHSRPGIRLHRPRSFAPEDRARHEGFPVTSVARTLLDLAPELSPTRLESMFERAERLRLIDMRDFERLRATHGHRGLRAFRALLDRQRPPVAETQSELERRFLAFCDRAALPRPAVNVVVEGFVVDAFWPDRRLVVELDSHAFHASRTTFENDRVRDAKLQRAGYRILRVTSDRLRRAPEEVLDDIHGLSR